jgi:hypothetical protein
MPKIWSNRRSSSPVSFRRQDDQNRYSVSRRDSAEAVDGSHRFSPYHWSLPARQAIDRGSFFQSNRPPLGSHPRDDALYRLAEAPLVDQAVARPRDALSASPAFDLSSSQYASFVVDLRSQVR